MNLLSKIALTTILSTLAFAETTMCFKENHKDMMTIEKVSLLGGECNNTKSVSDMKNEGWSVDDIKINGNDYIYIFKKEEIQTATIDMDALEAQILQRLEVRKVEAEKQRKIERKYNMSMSGKKIYIRKCQNCHGEKATKEPGNSRDVTKLNLFDFKTAIRDYNNGTYDRGTAMQMLPYANAMTVKEVSNVYMYIQSLKPKEKKSK